jgi:hypothetical protein
MVRQRTRPPASEHVLPSSRYVSGPFDGQVLAHESMIDPDRMSAQSPETRAIRRGRQLPTGIDRLADAIAIRARRVVRVGIKIPDHDEWTIPHVDGRLKYPIPAGPLGLGGLAILALRPVGSPSRDATRLSRRLRRFRFLVSVASIAVGWSEPDGGWELHPLKTNTFYTAHDRAEPQDVVV